MGSAALTAQSICGDGDAPGKDELASLRSLKRGVYTLRPIAAGAAIGRQDVMFAMPCVEGQTTSGQFSKYRAHFIATRDYERLDPVFENAGAGPHQLHARHHP